MMDTVDGIEIKITKGPSKTDLKIAVFEGKAAILRNSIGWLKVRINGASAEDDTFDCWEIEGRTIEVSGAGEYARCFKGLYNTRTRKGSIVYGKMWSA